MKPETFRSAAWKEIKTHVLRRLQELREQNDSQALDLVGTALIRGRIAELKDLLDLETLSPDPQHTATLFMGSEEPIDHDY